MKRILLLSDTHGYTDDRILEYANQADEVWHAGDIGAPECISSLEAKGNFRAVYGNIDGAEIRSSYPLDNRFILEGVDVWMTHIGGYPGRYAPRVKEILASNPPGMFICGHSHILKVMYDKKHDMLCMNPGAAGRSGFHKLRTMLRFTLEAGEPGNLEVIELGPRSKEK